MFALGDATATRFAPTAQVAASQGRYLAQFFNTFSQNNYMNRTDIQKDMGAYTYSHSGTLAYIGGDRAIADLPNDFHLGGAWTYLFWKSAYLTNLFSSRNRILVFGDWIKKSLFGRDISRE